MDGAVHVNDAEVVVAEPEIANAVAEAGTPEETKISKVTELDEIVELL